MPIEWEGLPKLYGYVTQIQVERGPDGPLILCGIVPEDSEKMAHFLIRLEERDPIVMAQLDLLRDAIQQKRKVRVTYEAAEGGGAHRIVAVRLHA